MTKILLVEDDKSLREIYGVRLLAEGYDIISAGDGEEALAMAIKERPDLIVSDVMMPKISGFDMLDILRSTTETRDIKVIMMTALSSEDQRQRGEQLGADRYLVKSQVGIEDVVRTVHDVLQDIPTAAPTPQQTFGTPGPSAVPRPSSPTPAPPRPAAPQPQPQMQPPQPAPEPALPPATPAPATPTAPSVQPEPPVAPPQQPAPQPQQPQQTQPQVAPPDPAAGQPATNGDQPAPAPEAQPAPTNPFLSNAQQDNPGPEPASQMPRPTAPFSTPRPANLGERIINPPETPTGPVDVSTLIEQELSSIGVNPAPAAPAAVPTPEPHAAAQPPAPTQVPVQDGGLPQPPAPAAAPPTPGQ